MALKSTLYLTADDPCVLIIEPWANEFTIRSGESCSVVAIHPTVTPTFMAHIVRGGNLVMWVNEDGATYEFWRGGKLELSNSIPIPKLPTN
jgi:hypothetical protein